MIEWRDVPGFNGYKASSEGRIRGPKGGILKTFVNCRGYNQVKAAGKTTVEHRIVALAFCENPQGKPFVNHINGTKTDNRAENLEWVTKSENQIHAIQTGLRTYKAESYPWFVCTEEVRQKIASLRSQGVKVKEIAPMVGLTWGHVYKILGGRA